MRARLARCWAFVKRVMRCGKALAKDQHLPKWLRVLFVVGCIQIPVLPFDEIALALAVGIMAVFYRPQLRGAWEGSR